MHISSLARYMGVVTTLLLGLTACGGGGGGAPASSGTVPVAVLDSSTVISGVAATGQAIANGTVNAKCVNGSGSATTAVDGSYSITANNLTLPCMVKVTFVNSQSASQTLYSWAATTANKTNITSVTDLLVANLTGGTAASAFSGALVVYTSDQVKASATAVGSYLSNKFPNIPVAPTDPIAATLVAKTSATASQGNTYDQMLDALKAANPADPTLETTKAAVATLAKAQTISFAAPGNVTLGAAPVTLSATSSSGLPVSFSSTTPSVCTVLNGALSTVSAGTCVIVASQSGGGANYAAAANVTVSLSVVSPSVTPPAAQTISFSAPGNQTLGGSPLTLSATASSGLTVTFSSLTNLVCSVSANTLTLKAIGTCTVQADQSGNSGYAAAASVTSTFTVSGTPQTVTFATPATQTVGVTPAALVATSSSGLPVSFSASPSSVCTVSGSTLSLVGAGTCTVTASQAGNATYAAATAVSGNFTVVASTQTTPAANSATNGKALYAANLCASCHGSPPSIQKVLLGANNPSLILSAINFNTGGMGMYKNLFSTQNLADLAAYLATPKI